MRNFIKIADGIDVKPLLSQLDANPELWDAHSIRKTAPNSPHNRMSDIWVRYRDVAPFEKAGDYRTFNDEHIPIWYPSWKALPGLRPIIFNLMAMTEGEMLGGVLITRIPAGQGIAPHADRGWHVQQYDKFYLSLRSSPGAGFYCDAGGSLDILEPEPGEIYLFDNRLNHWVENKSSEDRITLITCIRTEKYGRQSWN